MLPDMNSFLSADELSKIPFKSLGSDIRISRNARFYSPENISIGDHVRIDDFCILSGGKGIDIGSYVHIAAYCALYGNEGIRLADFTGLSSRVVIYTTSDDYSGLALTNPTIPKNFRPELKGQPVTLGKHVIIGTNSTILPGVTMAEGSALGAHSLLTKDAKAWTIYFGAPAKPLKKRESRVLALEKSLLDFVRKQS